MVPIWLTFFWFERFNETLAVISSSAFFCTFSMPIEPKTTTTITISVACRSNTCFRSMDFRSDRRAMPTSRRMVQDHTYSRLCGVRSLWRRFLNQFETCVSVRPVFLANVFFSSGVGYLLFVSSRDGIRKKWDERIFSLAISWMEINFTIRPIDGLKSDDTDGRDNYLFRV